MIMKERIKKIVITMLLMLGVITASALIYVFLPSWVYYSLVGLSFICILYECSKPEKEDDFHKKIQRLNGLNILRDCIGGSPYYDELKIKIMDETEKILKSIKL